MWRGLILAKALEQFLVDVRWGDLDYLLIDMPPGTGDIQMALAPPVAASRDARGHHPGAGRAEGRGARRRHGPPFVPEGARRRREHARVHRARRFEPRDLRIGRRPAAGRAHRRAARRRGSDRRRGVGRRRRRPAGRARASRPARPRERSPRSRARSWRSCCRRSRWPAAPRACSSWSRSSPAPTRTERAQRVAERRVSRARLVVRRGRRRVRPRPPVVSRRSCSTR